jgi:3-deoxy-manno-octulosonate cytidylyltransferase (CMP-KDO synthetase)
MIEHVWERASKSSYLTDLVIATDDERIASVARRFGARVRMTSPHHPTGTDRLAEVASAIEASLYVNIQGDEPLINPEAIDAAILPLTDEPELAMGTLRKKIDFADEVQNPNVVKVVTNLAGDAIYFSRSAIPFERDGRDGLPVYYKHIGLYVYRRDLLLKYPDLKVGPLEEAERLEQLRALENGFRIRVVDTEYESLGVDTPQDLERVNTIYSLVKSGGVNA